MKIARRIQEWLDDDSQGKRSLAFLAKKTKLSRSLFSKIKNGKLRATPDTLFVLAPILKVPVLTLLAEAGYIFEGEISELGKGRQGLPFDLDAALRDPEMVKIFGKLWKWKIGDPPVDLQALCDRILSLPPDQMVLVEGLIKNMAPRTT